MIGHFRGMSPAAAELMYIKLAQQLPEYGHEIYQALVHIIMCNVTLIIVHLLCLFVYRTFMEVASGWGLASLGCL